MAIINILSSLASLQTKKFRMYSEILAIKGCGHFGAFRPGQGNWHILQVIPWGQISLEQLRCPLLNLVHTKTNQVLYYNAQPIGYVRITSK